MKPARRRRILLAVMLIVLAAVVTPFIHFPAQHISNAVSRAIERAVTVRSASLRLLPQPAIELHNVTIGEDPAFGDEPMMTAPVVIATLRLSSIWRGRLEFGSISFEESGGVEPSFNLVRRADGQWNIESLMSRARSMPVAPTSARRSEPRPHFPYIQVTSGRLNFKAGVEKKVVALTGANFALWLASDQEWRARLKARPIRTDTSLSDTGTIEAEGAVRRGLQQGGATTVELEARLRGSQLGQLSALIYGRDRGWRGGTDAELKLSGTLSRPAVQVHATVNDFRRFDITSPDPLKLEAACNAQLDPERETLDDLHCTVPYGDGTVVVTGSVSDLSRRSYHLALEAAGVPVNRVLALVRRAKRDLPSDLAAEGLIDAQLTATRASRGEPGEWSGEAKVRRLVLRSGDSVLRFPTIGIGVGQDAGPEENPRGFLLTAQPFGMELGREKPATVAAHFDAAGYGVTVAGPAGIEDALRAARLVGMRAPTYHVHGEADVQLLISGVWAGFAPPIITGRAQITNASAELSGISAPLRIAAAQMELTKSGASLRKISASLGVDGPVFSGSVQIPRGCAHPQDCSARIDLKTAELELSGIAPLLAAADKHPWYEFFAGGSSSANLLMRAQAVGHVSIGRLSMAGMTATNVDAQVTLERGHVHLTDVRAQIFGGRHWGEWQADFTGKEPRYSGQGTLTRAAAADIAAEGKNSCCAGTINLTYAAHFSGKTRAEMLHSAVADASFEWNNGALNGFILPATTRGHHSLRSAPTSSLRFAGFSGRAELRDSAVALTRSKIMSQSGIYRVSGTLTVGGQLAITLASRSQSFNVAGTLADPVVAAEAQRAAAPTPNAPAATPTTAAAVKSGPGTD